MSRAIELADKLEREARINPRIFVKDERKEAAEELRRLSHVEARYLWLRDRSTPPHNFYISVPDEFHGVRYTPAEVDAYIDAALTSSTGEPK